MRKKMQNLLRIFLVIAMAVVLSGCCLRHEWKAADCEKPRTCARCGKTEGNPLGHQWEAADCITAKHCSICGESQGFPRGHNWVEAGERRTCTDCGESETLPSMPASESDQKPDQPPTEPETLPCEDGSHVLRADHFDTEWFVSICGSCGQEFREEMDDTFADRWIVGTWAGQLTFSEDGTATNPNWTSDGTWRCNGMVLTEYGTPKFSYTLFYDGLEINGGIYSDAPSTLYMADEELYFQFVGEKG